MLIKSILHSSSTCLINDYRYHLSKCCSVIIILGLWNEDKSFTICLTETVGTYALLCFIPAIFTQTHTFLKIILPTSLRVIVTTCLGLIGIDISLLCIYLINTLGLLS